MREGELEVKTLVLDGRLSLIYYWGAID